MLVKKESGDQIIWKVNKRIFLMLGIFAMLLVSIGASWIPEILSYDISFPSADFWGLIFMCVWISVAFSMGIYSFCISSKQIILDNRGVTCRTWLISKHLSWSEIEDWGLSYSGQFNDRNTGESYNMYFLYFSKTKYAVKNTCSKKLKGKMLQADVIGKEYWEIVEQVIPFCAKWTSVKPFIGVDKHHFL